MGTNIAVTTEDFLGNEDRRWLGTRMGANQCRSITLDESLFAANHLMNGALPSGVVLGQVTATKRFGPYNNGGTGGLDVAAGLLFSTTKLTAGGTGRIAVALFWGPGIVKTKYLPLLGGATTGLLDAAARTDLANFIRFEDD